MPHPLLALSLAFGLAGLLAWLLWPRRGLLARWRDARFRTEQILREDALKHLHRCQMTGQRVTLEGLAGALAVGGDRAGEILRDLGERGLVRHGPEGIELTARGRESALHIVRAHRLWERYLAEATGFHETEWHQRAERREHLMTSDEMDSLAAELGHPTHDPHGDPIPTSSGELVGHRGVPLPQAEVDVPLQIVHLEDEPDAVYAQLVAEGLHVGQVVRVIDKDERRLRFWAGDDQHLLAPIVADNVSVVERPETVEEVIEEGSRLADLRLGERAEVLSISPACRGPERRRLLDLGLLPGTEVKVELVSPNGDPKAYRIRGAVIALRGEQADWIRVRPLGEPEHA